MAANINPLSAISYTNKDFRSIVEELIDLTKKLTEKWDPSITNESDPAMVLLKLDAIIGDKNNYNIDKNILEAFPETLTQEVSARSMYNQLAYHMPWYQAATTEMVIGWKGRELIPGEIVEIPKFTMLCNSDSSVIYTLLTSVVFNSETLTNRVPAAQGIITDLVINGEKDIYLTNLDSNNRIYFGDNNVAENEVFITNVGQSTYWTQVNNLQVEHEGNTFYEFGVDVRSGNVYVEFPEDIETLIGNGINIKYLLCDGVAGNISASQITKFYEEVSVPIQNSEENDSILLNNDSFEIYNPAASVNGEDPQSIRDAYKSWKRTAGTYDTLVTLRDYINAIYNTGIVSNDIVSDRLTDIQCAYRIMTDRADYSTSIIKTDEGEMTAYDLKLYLLHNPGVVDNIESYEQTFEMESDASEAKADVIANIENQKCILHDFGDIKPDLPCLFRNLYQLQIKVVPQYFLNVTQIDELKRNIVSDLFEVLNSRQMEFGEEPDYYMIYDTIANADERIKLIVLDDFVFTTYATYWDGEKFKSIPVSDFNDPYIITGTLDELKARAKGLNNPQRFLFVENGTNNVYKYDIAGKKLFDEPYSKKINEFRKQILAKNILAGVTPLFDQETTFKYTIDQQEVSADSKDTQRLTTFLDVSPFGYEDELPNPKIYNAENNANAVATYTLKDNETIQFLGPSFKTSDSYAGGCYYEFIMNDPTGRDEEPFEAKVELFYYDSEKDAYSYNGVNIAMDKEASEDGEHVTLYYFDPRSSYKFVPIYETNYNGTAYEGKTFSEVHMVFRDEVNSLSFSDAFKSERITFYVEERARRVSSGESYRLKSGDKIVFFWRESGDDKDAPYLYTLYTGTGDISNNVIIKPNFTLNATDYDSSNLYKIGFYNTTNPQTSGKAAYNSDVFTNVQQLPVGNALSGTKSIDIQELNQVEYEPNTRGIYFITNNIFRASSETQDNREEAEKYGLDLDTDYYKITFTKEDKDDYLQYILGADEYFICINKSTMSYEMLSYGSMIRLVKPENSNIELSDEKSFYVKTVSYNDVAMEGTNSFFNTALFPGSDTTENYPSGLKLLLREQQVFNFAGGDSIMITLKNDYPDGTAFPKFTTGVWTPVDNFEVKYKTADAVAYEDLPKIAVSETSDEKWRGTAILNVDSSKDDSQAINNNPQGATDDEKKNNRQSIQQFTINGVRYPSNKDESSAIDGAIEDTFFKILYLLSSVPITKVGGSNIDISYLNEYGEIKNVDILVYELNPAFTSDGFDKIGDNILLSIDGKSHTVKDIQLELGYKYIMGIVNNSSSATFSIKGNKADGSDFNMECLTESGKTTGFGKGSWFFSIDQQNISDEKDRFYSFTISLDSAEENSSLVFEELLKCKDNNFYDDIDNRKAYGITSKELLATVNELDKIGEVHYFKYNYTVPDDILIEDPLKGKTFFNENHVFNQYTIGQAQMRMAGYNDNDSNIIIVSNR